MNRTSVVIAYVGPKFKASHPNQDCQACIESFQRDIPAQIDLYHDIQTLLARLAEPGYQVDAIGIDLEYLHIVKGSSMFDVIRTVAVFLKCMERDTYIVGAVGDDTDPSLIRQALQAPEIRTLVMRLGGTWTYDMVLETARRIHIDQDWTVPTAIKDRIKAPTKKPRHPPTTIVLTPRQTQILDLVSTRGASNKVIARTLKISESTVKLHMSAILKKYGCRNRTQLAVFSRDRVKTLASWIMAVFLGVGTTISSQSAVDSLTTLLDTQIIDQKIADLDQQHEPRYYIYPAELDVVDLSDEILGDGYSDLV